MVPWQWIFANKREQFCYLVTFAFRFFKTHKVQDFARPGNKATETVVIKEGPLPSISYVSEDQLRKLGLPIELKRGLYDKI